MKKLGIIGGMGPAATMYFASRVVDLTQARNDQDHIDITILNRSWIPDRSAFLNGDTQAPPFCPSLVETSLQLERMGCRVLCMPCNTAHACFEQIEDALLKAKMVSMPGSVAQVVSEKGFHRVGILATSGTQKAHVYEGAFASIDACLVWPNAASQEDLMRIIYQEIKQGNDCAPECLDNLFRQFLLQDCDAVVVGCTELSMLLSRDSCSDFQHFFDCNSSLPLPVIDALEVLALRCVGACGAKARDSAEVRNRAISFRRVLDDQVEQSCQREANDAREEYSCAG